MAQAPKYVKGTDFSDEESRNVGGRSTIRTAALDAELDALGTTANALRDNLALVQRSDGRIADGVVEPHTLSISTKALIGGGWNPRGNWTTSTSYAVKDVVEYNNKSYVCATAHTSSADFNTDDAAGYWVILSEVQGIAGNVSFDPTPTISATRVQTAIEELDDDLRPSNVQMSHYHFRGL